MKQVKEEIVKISQEYFPVEGQSKRFLIEFQDIQQECEEQKHELIFVQNQKTINWLEIDIGFQISVELKQAQEVETLHKAFFSIWIGKQYPLKDIKVFCKTTFVRPSLADGRNLLHDILNGNWCYKNSLVTIVKKLPQLIERVLQYRQDKIYLQTLGQYYLGGFYYMDELKAFTELHRFPAIQMSSAFFPQVSVRLICLSEAHFYMFEVADNNIQDKLRLIFRAPLQSCIQLRRRRDKNCSEVNITWYNYKTKLEDQQLFKINEFDYFIRIFLRKLNNFPHMRMFSNSYLVFNDQTQVEKEKITEIMRSIHELEVVIEKKFNSENVTKLMDHYQSAIEFYSSASDYLYEVYLNKLQQLIQREDVQIILQYNKLNK